MSEATSADQDEQATDEVGQYLTFILAGETYALNILSIREIIEYGDLTPVPMMPDVIAGAINLRGSVVPVVDLSVRLKGQRSVVGKRTSIVIVEHAVDETAIELGLIVDAVNEVLEIWERDIEPPPSFGTGIRTDFIQGMGKVEGKFLVLLEPGKVLSLDELSNVGGTLGASAGDGGTERAGAAG